MWLILHTIVRFYNRLHIRSEGHEWALAILMAKLDLARKVWLVDRKTSQVTLLFLCLAQGATYNSNALQQCNSLILTSQKVLSLPATAGS